ncbi:RluA family pseudouridine synthase [Mycoplasmopsis fermentans]|uniref:RluA family pseudouridine synthase n=1 Tax=Mycoplasmopsis fermentans TaxID=2115 RepID=UPI000F03596B|nr:RluA family pseudouridine synthase [Mycoplasmopsis fermentans]RMX36282.1 RNA pseudouridylate synthase family protein [Mycoplasmopsis fermentans MF-I2]RMX36360.1 RNA pseudouridylate synthase family protein [Mycoplasmopsis fermentans MF-I1]
MLEFIATKNDDGRKLISYLKRILINTPTSHIYKILRNKDIKINGVRINDPQYIINEKDIIQIYGIEANDYQNKKFENSAKKDFKIIYEDDNILIVSKPINLSVHSENNCLDKQVLSYLKYNQKDSFKPSHVGRLDKATSGLMIYAKNYATLVELNYKTSFFEKIYKLKSDFKEAKKLVEINIQHDEKLHKMVVTNNTKDPLAKTLFYTKNNKIFASILTGKKHQIRLSMAHLKTPIYGDIKYGGKKADRLYLHCYSITFKNLDNSLKYLNNKEFNDPINW